MTKIWQNSRLIAKIQIFLESDIFEMGNFVLHKHAIISLKIDQIRDYLSKYDLFSWLTFLKIHEFFFLCTKWYSKRKFANSWFTRQTVEIWIFLVADTFQVCDFLFTYAISLLKNSKLDNELSKHKFSSRMIIFKCTILLHKYSIISPKSGKIRDYLSKYINFSQGSYFLNARFPFPFANKILYWKLANSRFRD